MESLYARPAHSRRSLSRPAVLRLRIDLPGFESLRLHNLDEGKRDAVHTFLCLHGPPTWCCLHRTMIREDADAGHVALERGDDTAVRALSAFGGN